MGELIRLEAAKSYGVRRDLSIEPRLDGRQLRSILNVSDSTLKRWRAAGMPYERWGRRTYRYLLHDVLSWRDGV